MLIKITNKCNNTCTHCMDDANMEGVHMSDETVETLKALIKEVKPLFLQISGGEPTLHPKWIDICLEFKKLAYVILETNGWWLGDKEKEYEIKKLAEQGVLVQIRTHPDYYPDYEKTIQHSTRVENWKNVELFDDEVYLYPLGRAQTNKLKPDPKCSRPFCMNCFLIVKQGAASTFKELVNYLHGIRKFCKPLIDADGSIKAGESTLCRTIGSVDNPDSVIENLKKGKPCNKCGLFTKDFEKWVNERLGGAW